MSYTVTINRPWKIESDIVRNVFDFILLTKVESAEPCARSKHHRQTPQEAPPL